MSPSALSNTKPTAITTSTSTSALRPTASVSMSQWHRILANIRTNLTLVESTWGRGSKQYAEAKGVMLAYLQENLDLRGENEGGNVDVEEVMRRGEQQQQQQHQQRGMEVEMEMDVRDATGAKPSCRGDVARDIEAMLRELKL